MIIATLALIMQAAIALPPVTVHTRSADVPVRVTAIDGAPFVVANRLAAALGGTFRLTSPSHYSLAVGDAHVSFTTGVPFAGDDSTIVPLSTAPRLVGSDVYLPYYVVSVIVPRFFAGFAYDPATREIRAFDTTARRVAESEPTTRVARDDDSVATDSSPADDGPGKKRHRRRLIVVDAGHGGPDKGMTGPIIGGPHVVEKNITLSVAKLVAQSLRDAGADVLMTRTTDTLIALADRGRIANKHHGDVFVSIHVNATGSRGRDAIRDRGYETYFLAEAKSEDARRVENMENESVKFETGANAPKGDPLSFILNDMAQNEHLRESADLAQTIQDSFKSFHPGPNRGVQQANFAVLRGSYMPAVLVEIGFGTNTEEAGFISDPDNQRTIARAISRSVLAYLDHYAARIGAGK